MIFPENPLFFCIHCGAAVTLKGEDLERIGKHTFVRCTACGHGSDTDYQYLYKFCKFYRRLTLANEDALGVRLTGYSINDAATYSIYVDDIVFECLHCHKSFTITMKRLRTLSKTPGLFKCPKCRALPPKLKDIGEYLLCLYWVLQLGTKGLLARFQYDYFSAVGMPSESFQLRLQNPVSVPKHKASGLPQSLNSQYCDGGSDL